MEGEYLGRDSHSVDQDSAELGEDHRVDCLGELALLRHPLLPAHVHHEWEGVALDLLLLASALHNVGGEELPEFDA